VFIFTVFFVPRSSASIEVRQAAAQCVKSILATQSGVDFWEQHKDNRDPMLTYLNPFRKAKEKVGYTNLQNNPFSTLCSPVVHQCISLTCMNGFSVTSVSDALSLTFLNQVEVVSDEVSLEARKKLVSEEFWIPRAGGHKAWLNALCTSLLDSGGVRREALLLSRPLCLVSPRTLAEDLSPCLHTHTV